ncbi:hypothetical protein ACLB2K_063624 [Fragaria x ananassa]
MEMAFESTELPEEKKVKMTVSFLDDSAHPWWTLARRNNDGAQTMTCEQFKALFLERVGSLAYRLALPSKLSRIHNVFHVSMLRKYIADPSHVLEEQPISLQKDLSYEKELVQILDWKEQVLRSKSFPLVKVLWRSHQVEEATWESKEQMRQQYPYLFK